MCHNLQHDPTPCKPYHTPLTQYVCFGAHGWTSWKQIRRAVLKVTISTASQKSIKLLFTAHRLSRSCFMTVASDRYTLVMVEKSNPSWSNWKQTGFYIPENHTVAVLIPTGSPGGFFKEHRSLVCQFIRCWIWICIYRQLHCINKVILGLSFLWVQIHIQWTRPFITVKAKTHLKPLHQKISLFWQAFWRQTQLRLGQAL